METSEKKSIIIVALLLMAIVFGTCEFRKHLQPQIAAPSADAFVAKWEAEKKALVESYDQKIGRLQQVRDSLWFLVSVKKVQMADSRQKTQEVKSQLQRTIERQDSNQVVRDSIKPLVDSLVIAQAKNDSLCDETVKDLENVVANRDSSISYSKLVEINLKNLNKEQELKNQDLTQQVNQIFKEQKRQTRHKKILAGCVLFLTGITTAILISHRSQ